MSTSRSAGQGKPAQAVRERRHLAREAAIQMLYAWEVGRTDLDEVLSTYPLIEGPEVPPPSASVEAFQQQLVRGVVARLLEIDALIAERAEHWRLARMAIVDRLILRLAVYEFLDMSETPRTVVINEALELAKTFGDDESVRFVNGVLDGIKRRLEERQG